MCVSFACIADLVAIHHLYLSMEALFLSLFNFVILTTAQEVPPFGIRSIVPSPPIGGFNEEPFLDKVGGFPGGSEPIIIGVDTINVSFVNQKRSTLTGQVTSIQVTYRLSNGSLYTAPRHGRSNTINCYDFYGCRNLTIRLAPSEFIESIDGKTDGTKVNQMSIHTRNVKNHEKRIFGPLGCTGVKSFSFEGRVVSFFGNAGFDLNGIGTFLLLSAKPGPYFGTKLGPGTNFDDDPDTMFAVPVAKIAKIHIYFNDTVYAIQAEYFLMNGTTVSGNTHGSDSKGIKSTIEFSISEVLTGVMGMLSGDEKCVDQITLITRKKDGSSGKYGPYGSSSGGKAFSSFGHHILGFSGNTGKSLNGISAYFEQYP